MATTVGSHSVAAFVNPSNGDALDATVVKGNDNTLRTAYVNHDADTGIHVQSSVLASRPAAGTAGRKWMTTDGGVKLWYDTGSVWEEVAYVPSTGTVTISGATTFSSTVTVTGTATFNGNVVLGSDSADSITVNGDFVSNLIPNATNTYDLGVTGTRWRNLFLSGNATVTGDVTVTGTVTATTFSGSGASLTALNASNLDSGTVPDARFPSTLPAISGANLTNLNASNISSGTINSARLPTISFATNSTTSTEVTSGSNTLKIASGESFFLDSVNASSWVIDATGSSVAANWSYPTGLTTYNNTSDVFIAVKHNSTTYYIRCERWT